VVKSRPAASFKVAQTEFLFQILVVALDDPAVLENRKPLPWQEDLFLRFCKCDIPKDLDLPTGCGKTSAMAAWLLALAHQAQAGPEGVSLQGSVVCGPLGVV